MGGKLFTQPSFNKYLFSTYYVPDTVRGTGNTEMNKKITWNLYSREVDRSKTSKFLKQMNNLIEHGRGMGSKLS